MSCHGLPRQGPQTDIGHGAATARGMVVPMARAVGLAMPTPPRQALPKCPVGLAVGFAKAVVPWVAMENDIDCHDMLLACHGLTGYAMAHGNAVACHEHCRGIAT